MSENFIFFWKPDQENGEFGQWFPSDFSANGIQFNCAEQYMMFHKISLFESFEVAQKVLQTNDPKVQKMLGQTLVSVWDEAKWLKWRMSIVVRGNMAKFGQNPDLMKVLLATKNKILVEASPLDTIWGIGLAATSPKASSPGQWRGLNLLGRVCMIARAHYIARSMFPVVFDPRSTLKLIVVVDPNSTIGQGVIAGVPGQQQHQTKRALAGFSSQVVNNMKSGTFLQATHKDAEYANIDLADAVVKFELLPTTPITSKIDSITTYILTGELPDAKTTTTAATATTTTALTHTTTITILNDGSEIRPLVLIQVSEAETAAIRETKSKQAAEQIIAVLRAVQPGEPRTSRTLCICSGSTTTDNTLRLFASSLASHLWEHAN
eukprot:c12631_g1_i1.p1 GENE.c12631_g1_i1~~c12631_g1_i1.p1  ORF type:complete len:379 (-),score=100.35 c12631_g1_i1:196-1332(-)